MTTLAVERTDWRMGSGLATPRADTHHGLIARLIRMGFGTSGPAQLGISDDGSLLLNPVLFVLSHDATASPVVVERLFIDLFEKAANETAAQILAQDLRRLSGLTNEELASLLGVSRRSFQTWLAGGAISERRESRLRRLVEILREMGDLGPQEMRARLLDKDKWSVRAYDLLAEGRFDAAVALVTGRRSVEPKLRSSERETVAEQFDRDQRSLPNSEGSLNRSLSKLLRR